MVDCRPAALLAEGIIDAAAATGSVARAAAGRLRVAPLLGVLLEQPEQLQPQLVKLILMHLPQQQLLLLLLDQLQFQRL